MTSYIRTAFIALAVFVSFGSVAATHAQTDASMPVIFNQNGTPINTGTGYLQAGIYFLGSGPRAGGHQIEYYGNGTYYDSSVGLYGGSVQNSGGTAGMSLGYVLSDYAGTAFNTALMPTLYSNQNFTTSVNSGSAYLSAGYYYIADAGISGGHQIYYFGDGTYYNPLSQTYGGSVTNSNGTAGANLGYSS